MQGGRIYLGVREDGSVVGVDDAKALQEAILSVLQMPLALMQVSTAKPTPKRSTPKPLWWLKCWLRQSLMLGIASKSQG